MWAKPTKRDLNRIPRLYSTENKPLSEKVIHIHFFMAGCDWYIAEFDGEDIMFGFCILNNTQTAEWGNVSLQELRNLKLGFLEVDTDKYWVRRTAGSIDKITACPNGV